MTAESDLARELNLGCACTTLQARRLDPELLETHPTLFSRAPVFVAAEQQRAIVEAVAALDRAGVLPGLRREALERAGLEPARTPGAAGVFMGYDFHLADAGPRLIEINTNAGGAFLHALGLQAHRACCTDVDDLLGLAPDPGHFEQAVLAMFRSEWQASRGDEPLRSIAIVDDLPETQYLAPEFELARRLFASAGIAAVVGDPSEFDWRDGRLWHPGLPHAVDLVYNRLTDFRLREAGHEALRRAHESDAIVLTPHPQAHAIHADKRNLVALSDPGRLRACGLPAADVERLAAVVPRTREVSPLDAAPLWRDRRSLFFKPAAGFGSRGAYRGDKLTRRVWDSILAGGYVAQDLVAPGERLVQVEGESRRLKVDIRAYAYRGQVLLLAARMYDGQTTNFRTPGGGFAPVVVLPPLAADQPCQLP